MVDVRAAAVQWLALKTKFSPIRGEKKRIENRIARHHRALRPIDEWNGIGRKVDIPPKQVDSYGLVESKTFDHTKRNSNFYRVSRKIEGGIFLDHRVGSARGAQIRVCQRGDIGTGGGRSIYRCKDRSQTCWFRTIHAA